MIQEHFYGWIPDLPDHRDLIFKRVKPKVKILDESDWRKFCSPVEDQDNLGSCTANAGVGVNEILDLSTGQPLIDMSRLFLYFNTRRLEGTILWDSGASIRNTIKAWAKWGICPENLWPYVIEKFAQAPPTKCYTKALKHKALVYERIETLNDMLGCLSEGYPFIFGFTVYPSFETEAVARTGKMIMPKKNERPLGGHAVVAVGHSIPEKIFIIRNSWGPGWGDKGYFYMPFNYLIDRNLSDDLWVVRKAA